MTKFGEKIMSVVAFFGHRDFDFSPYAERIKEKIVSSGRGRRRFITVCAAILMFSARRSCTA